MRNKYEIRGDVTAIFINYKGNILETLIDTEDLPIADSYTGTWYAGFCKQTKSFYTQSTYQINKVKKTIRLHNLIINRVLDKRIDHINHDTLNNLRSNLRQITHAENCQNKNGLNSNNKSGVRGVSWNVKNNSWFAEVRINGKRVFQQYFKDINKAKLAIIEARIRTMECSIS